MDQDQTIDFGTDDRGQIVEANLTASGLASLREKYAGAKFDCTNNKGDGEARHARLELKTLRTSVEKRRKELKAPLLEHGRLIDAEASRIESELRALEEPIDAQIKAVEQAKAAALAEAERIRVERHAKMDKFLEEIRLLPALYAAAPAEILASEVTFVENLDLMTNFTEERIAEAGITRDNTLTTLRSMHANAVELEARAAEMAAERERQAEARAEIERAKNEAQAILDAQREELEQQQAAFAKIQQDATDKLAAEEAAREAEAREAAEKERAAFEEERDRQIAHQQQLDAEHKIAEAARLARFTEDYANRVAEEQRLINTATLNEAIEGALALLDYMEEDLNIATRTLRAAYARHLAA